MFDFAISQNQRRRPTRRIFASYILSCLIHLICLLLVIRYPQLLQGGKYHHFHPLSVIANLLSASDKTADEDKDWRTVAVLRGPMMQPSAATLKKYLHDWNQKGPGSSPIRIRWGNEEKALENSPPMPRTHQEPKTSAPVAVPPPNEGIESGAAGTASAQSPGGNLTDAASGSSSSSTTVQADSKKATVNLPPPAPKPDIASNSPPTSIPNGIKPHANNTSQSSGVFENEQKAIQSPGSGIFGTGGI